MSERSKASSSSEKAILINGDQICDFCGIATNDLIKYGPKYQLGSVKTHYYCVLLSSKLKQNGEDNEGLLGFLLEDIKNELERCSQIKCIYCNKKSANISCKQKNCQKCFHLPCGLKVGSLHQFKDCYNSYCHNHRKFQYIPNKILKEAQTSKVKCSICYDKVPLRNKMKYIWAPCCQKTWYHKKCLQRLALSAGYFFRCAICNNSTKFVNCALNFGVFIPQQDASWELVPDAFSELLFKYSQCDADLCECPDGRTTNLENSMWEVILCKSCGSQGIHIGCISSNFISFDWECPSCQKVTNKFNFKKSGKSQEDGPAVQTQFKTSTPQEVVAKKRIRNSEDLEYFILDKRKKCKSEIEDDVEIDVVTVDKTPTENKTEEKINQSNEIIEGKKKNMRQDVGEASIKPGPLSIKLKMIGNYAHILESSEKPKGEKKDLSGNNIF